MPFGRPEKEAGGNFAWNADKEASSMVKHGGEKTELFTRLKKSHINDIPLQLASLAQH